MEIEYIHSYLTAPAKHLEDQPEVQGVEIALRGRLYEMLHEVFLKAPDECDIEIMFNPDENGEQKNEMHELFKSYSKSPSIESGEKIALRLQKITTKISGLGLLFLIKGKSQNEEHFLVVTRFPAEQGIMANESKGRLSVEFVERVFMKNARTYKNAFYRTKSLDAGFHKGKAVDKQASGNRDLSDYWIRNFLDSEFRTTGPAGSKRLAKAFKSALKNAKKMSEKRQIISATELLNGFDGNVFSANDLIERLGLSNDVKLLVEKSYPRVDLMHDKFPFDSHEFSKHVVYRSVELDNGALLMANNEIFSDVFESEEINSNGIHKYSTEGRVVNQKFKKTK